MGKKAGFVAAVKARARPYQVCGVRRVLTAIDDASFRAEVESAIGGRVGADRPQFLIVRALRA